MAAGVAFVSSTLWASPPLECRSSVSAGHGSFPKGSGGSIGLCKAAINTLKEGQIELRSGQNAVDIKGCCEDVIRLCKDGNVNAALHVVSLLEQGGIWEGSNTYGQILQGYINTTTLRQGKRIHGRMIKTGFETQRYIGNCLINMYVKCGRALDARQVFDQMAERNEISWTAMIGGYARNGHPDEALKVFFQMRSTKLKANQFTFGSVLRACASLENLQQGKQVHACVVKSGSELDICVRSALVDMYCKSGNVVDARTLLDRTSEHNVVSWTAMIAGYAKNGNAEEALNLFSQMQPAGLKPNHYTFTTILGVCTGLAHQERGKQVHAHVIKTGFQTDVRMRIALVDLYAKCGSLADASKIFSECSEQDVVICTAMIGGYAQNGQGEDGLLLFCQMQERGTRPNHITFTTVLGACASLAALDCGKQVHALVLKAGIQLTVNVGGALVDMYAKCGSVEAARNVFDNMAEQNAISCSAMIAGCALNGHAEEALNLFCKLHQAGMELNRFTFASVLRACASIADLEQGNQIHLQIIKTGFESDVYVGSVLVDMYAKCGSLRDAHEVFDKMPERDRISWTAIIGAYAQHGHGREALQFFEQMQAAGVTPNEITFVSVLSACSHAGLVGEGRHYFSSMERDHGILPTLQHYACMIDLLGRAGQLDEAEEFINKMPCEPSVLVWRTLLSACRIHGNMDLGAHAAECILELEPQDTAAYVLLSNIYAAAGRWDDVSKVRNKMKDKRVQKEPGLSWIEVENIVHTFAASDTLHPQTKEIYAKLEELTVQMREAGYVLQTDFVLNDVED